MKRWEDKILNDRASSLDPKILRNIMHAVRASVPFQQAIERELDLPKNSAISWLVGQSEDLPEDLLWGVKEDKSLPDIDIDFSDQQRHRVFDYLRKTYGIDRVARLGTVAMFKARSSLQEAGAALKIPRWKCDAVAESLIERSGADSRATDTLIDTLMQTVPGKELLAEYPEAVIAGQMEGHPRHYSQHAAGVVVASEPISNYVAIDHRTNATMCDKIDAEGRLGLLKIDALGLTQLSVFEDAVYAAGMTMQDLQRVPLDDPAAFAVLNRGEFSGVFQWNGNALQSLTRQVVVDRFNDIVAISALARPGPLATGGATQWANRRMSGTIPPGIHPMLDSLTSDTYGVVIYQEQVMRIVREMGGLSWADTSSVRKGMSKSLGNEFFEQFKKKFVDGSGVNGVSEGKAVEIWDQINTFGCLSGETLLALPDSNQHSPSEITIEELFFNGGYSKVPSSRDGKIAQQGRPKAHLWSVTENHVHGNPSIQPQRIADIWQSGIKETLLVELEGKSIRATKEHKFLVLGKGWQRLGDISEGQQIAVMGSGHKGKKWKGVGSGAHNEWHGESKRFQEQILRLRAKFDFCQVCKEHPYEETHHIDESRLNNELSNLLPVCRKCHKSLHKKPIRFSRGRQVDFKRVNRISSPRTEMTYDISMEPGDNFVANGIITHNSWAFNKSHAVAYGYISYWCCWLKANHPFEFAAATLTHENDPSRQIELLREMRNEGYDYLPVDADLSTDKWTAGSKDGKKVLVGPLQNVKGIGPKLVSQIIGARNRGEAMPERAKKLLADPKTEIDSLSPVSDAFKRVMPDPSERNINTPVTPIGKLKPSKEPYEAMIFCTPLKINPRDENEIINVQKRGHEITDGRTDFLQIRLSDDSGTIMGKVNRFNFRNLGPEIINKGRAGKSLWAFKGKIYTVGDNFLVFSISQARYIGDTEE